MNRRDTAAPLPGAMTTAALAVLVILMPPASAAATAACTVPAARFASIEGDVQVRDAAQAWQRAELASRLCNGDSVRVGARSRAAMVLANQAVMRLDQNTTMRLTNVAPEPEKRGVVELLKGAAQSFIRRPRSLSVNTPYLNGSIEGTEFQVRVDDGQASLQVMEGQVRVASAGGEVLATAGTIAEARAGSAPVLATVVRPLDAVQWTLHVPPLYSTATTPAALAEPLRRWRAGDADAAHAAFDAIPAASRDADWHLARASLLLEGGRVDEARAAVAAALVAQPGHGRALALRALLALLGNDADGAIADARAAVAADDGAPTRIALSYALQARFALDAALDVLRSAPAPAADDALLLARRAELELMLGEVATARITADRALAREPELARAQAVSGFVALALHDGPAARAAFDRALALAAADPLPHLGRGLALIADGDLAAGRAELEIAIALDPNQALLRAYLGKAYYEERRGTIDAQQFALARTLDPKDPTAFLYDALRKQAENRPIEALDDLRQSMALNDNRAVYRGRLLLDRDQATRGAGLAKAYRDVGHLESGLAAVRGALADDPGEASAHRFLSDVYGGQRRREIARVSELLQAQLQQDFQLAPLSPSAGEANLNLATASGPAGYNEFTSLFQRDRLQGTASITGGNYDSLGGEAALSGVHGPFSFGVGALDWKSDGWRPNNDLSQAVYTLFGQAALSPAFNVQAEYRHRETREGDLAFNFEPDDYIATRRVGRDIDSARLGLRWSPSVRDRVLLSYIRSWREEDQRELRDLPPVVGETTFSNRQAVEETANQVEAQYLRSLARGGLIAGLAYTRGQRLDDIDVSVDDTVLGNLLSIQAQVDAPSRDRRAYAYLNTRIGDDWLVTNGASVQRYEQPEFAKTYFNPKLGVQWQALDTLALRAAMLKTLKPTLVTNRSLEPTQVAGFNQLFDDLNGTRSRLYGVGADWRPLPALGLGVEATRRDLGEVQIDFEGGGITEDRDETIVRGYLNWSATTRLAMRGALAYDRYRADSGIATQADNVPERVRTWSLPVGFSWFEPNGLFFGAMATAVRQSVRRDPFATQASGRDDFAVVDLDAGWRLPRRLGVLSIAVRNVLDTGFRYQDDSYREFRDEPSVGPFFPVRTITARLVLGY